MKSPPSSIAAKWTRIVLSVNTYLECLGTITTWTQLGVNLPDDSVIDRVLQSLPPSYKGFVMNYNMKGMGKRILKLAMLKAAEVEIKKEHQVLMVNKTTSFKKKAKGRKGTSRRRASKLLLKGRIPSPDLSLKLSAYTAKGLVTGSRTAPSIWRIIRMAK